MSLYTEHRAAVKFLKQEDKNELFIIPKRRREDVMEVLHLCYHYDFIRVFLREMPFRYCREYSMYC